MNIEQINLAQDRMREAWMASIPEKLRKGSRTVSERDQHVVALRGQGLAQSAIAARFGISQQMVAKILRKARI